jgi:hypothetical protein
MHVPDVVPERRRRATTTVYPTTATLLDDGGDGRTDAGHVPARAGAVLTALLMAPRSAI